MSDAAVGELFDSELESAVRLFQKRHGLGVDGVVGKDTLVELNRPLEEQIQQLVVNLERWRWMPQSLGRRHVLVNISGFEVREVEDGVPVLILRAIVGRPFRRTPVFSDHISYLVLNPSWIIYRRWVSPRLWLLSDGGWPRSADIVAGRSPDEC